MKLDSMVELIKKRRSVRAFDTKRKVEKNVLLKLCEAGQWAPSPSNIQSLRFIALDGRTDDMELIKSIAPGLPNEATAAVVVCSDQDAACTFSGEAREVLCTQEAAAAAQNICLVATSAGLGSCFVGSFSAAGLRKALDIPVNIKPVLIVALGYPDAERLAKTPQRSNFDEVVHWNSWR